MVIISLVFSFWVYVLYKNIKHNHLVWEIEKARINEKYNKEQEEIREAFRKIEELRQTMLDIHNLVLSREHKTRNWSHTKHFVDLAHNAHCLLYPHTYLQRKSFSERLRVFGFYKTAIYQIPKIRCTRKFWTKNEQHSKN